MAKRKNTAKSQTTENKATTEEQKATETQQEETKVEETQESTQTEETSTGSETQASEDQSTSKEETETKTEDKGGDKSESTKGETKEPQPKPEPKLAVSQDDRVATVQKALDEYVANMSGNVPVTEDDVRTNQIRLKNTINAILSSNDEIFDEVFTEAVKRIRANRTDAFRDVLVYRGFANMRIRQEERKRFEMLLQLLLACSDSKNIKSIGDKVDLSVVLRYVKNDEQANRLQSFFG